MTSRSCVARTDRPGPVPTLTDRAPDRKAEHSAGRGRTASEFPSGDLGRHASAAGVECAVARGRAAASPSVEARRARKSASESASGRIAPGRSGVEPGGEQAAVERPRGPLAELGGRSCRRSGDGSSPNASASARANSDAVHHLGPGDVDQARVRPPRPARRPPGRRRGRSSGSRPGPTGRPAACPPRGSWPADRRSSCPAARARRPRTSARSAARSPSASARARSASSFDWP